jgi:hypothetical protein
MFLLGKMGLCELSALQDEAKKRDEPLTISRLDVSVRPQYNLTVMMPGTRGPWIQEIVMETNKYVSNEKIADALKSITDTQVQPRCYVDWSKILVSSMWGTANYVFVGKDGTVWAMRDYPEKDAASDSGFRTTVPLFRVATEWPGAIIGPLPPWDKSLIRRPGAKE